jgi:hypothetical protein
MNDQATLTRRETLLGATALSAASALGTQVALAPSSAEAQTSVPAHEAGTVRWDELAQLPFPNGYPTADAAKRLRDELLFQRAGASVPLGLACYEHGRHARRTSGDIRRG